MLQVLGLVALQLRMTMYIEDIQSCKQFAPWQDFLGFKIMVIVNQPLVHYAVLQQYSHTTRGADTSSLASNRLWRDNLYLQTADWQSQMPAADAGLAIHQLVDEHIVTHVTGSFVLKSQAQSQHNSLKHTPPWL